MWNVNSSGCFRLFTRKKLLLHPLPCVLHHFKCSELFDVNSEAVVPTYGYRELGLQCFGDITQNQTQKCCDFLP